MELVIASALGLVLGLAIGAVAAWLVARTRMAAVGAAAPAASQQLELLELQHRAQLMAVQAEERQALTALQADHAALQATASALREQVRAAETRLIELGERMRAEADERLRIERAEAEKRAAAERAESKVLQALSPVQESLRTMQAKVTELESQRSMQHGELTEQLRLASANDERLRSTAESLAAALRNNSTRGVWGETQLRSVVEAAGLLQRVNFDVQSSITSDRGAGRPDMVVNLPGGKSIAVDAKVPFNAYIEANAIPATASEGELARKAALLKQHVKAVRDHITTLGSKAYWEGLAASPEMVVAFIPSESLLSSALEADPTIMEFAFSKRVALASPVTLFSVLKTVAVSWQQATATEEAKTLLDLSRELYGRLATMAGHIEKLGRDIKSTVTDYNKFIGSLERQVLPSARKLNALDEAKVLGQFEAVEESTRELTAIELTGALERPSAVRRELAALDETGVGRPELDLGLPEGEADEAKTA